MKDYIGLNLMRRAKKQSQGRASHCAQNILCSGASPVAVIRFKPVPIAGNRNYASA